MYTKLNLPESLSQFLSCFLLFLAASFSLYQMTPLHVAAEKSDLEIVEYLVGLTDQEVDINIQDDYGVGMP